MIELGGDDKKGPRRNGGKEGRARPPKWPDQIA